MNEFEDPPGWVTDLALAAAADVPAYGDHLRLNGVAPESSMRAPFNSLPPVDKTGYLRAHAYPRLLRKGEFDEAFLVSTSSGSSGRPFYWARGSAAAEEGASLFGRLLRAHETEGKSVLCVIAFAMGSWIAGTYTLQSLERLRDGGHRFTVVTPGVDIEASVQALEDLGPHFDKSVLFGYPPFVAEIVDAAIAAGVPVESLGLSAVVAGESISERWRDRLSGRLACATEMVTSIYGTADIGIVGYETPRTIALRRAASEDPDLSEELFGGPGVLPTLVEFDPSCRWVEEVEGRLLITGDNVLPLVRYAIGDFGRVFTPSSSVGSVPGVASLPHNYDSAHMVALFGRPDVAAIFYSLNIYPENVKAGLENPKLEGLVSGKFQLRVRTDPPPSQRLMLAVELADGVDDGEDLRATVQGIVAKAMKGTNSEYRRICLELGDDGLPHVELLRNGAPEFDLEIKHAWIAPDS